MSLDLEDRLLKQNIPGKASTWDGDGDEDAEKARAAEVDEGEEEDDDDPEPLGCEGVTSPEGEVPEAMRYGEAPGSRRGGVKGQLAQYKYFKKMQYEERLAKRRERVQVYVRTATGARRSPDDPVPEASCRRRPDADADDDEEDEFLRRYRERRVEELRRNAGKPSFGTMRHHVDKEDYVRALDVDDRVVVAVHLTEPTYPSCRRLEASLALVAPRRPDLSFVSMTLAEAEQPFEPHLLPILALYKGGDVVETLFRVTERLDPLNELADLEELIDNAVTLAEARRH